VRDEQNSLPQLPKGWVWTTFGEISEELKAGGTPLTKVKEYYENGTIPFVKIEDIVDSKKYLYDTTTKITEEGLRNCSAWVVPKNSILYSMYASYGEPIINKTEVATSQAIIAYIPPDNLMVLDYVYYYLKKIRPELTTRGTTQRNLNAQIVRNLPVPLAPFSEQGRIVAKVEELFTNLDAGVKSLKKVKTQLKRYRQAVLKYAFQGKLTAEWRKTHKDQIEPARVLLEHILRKRRENWEADQLAKMKAKEITPKGDGWKKRYKEPIGPELVGLLQLPKEWIWVNLGQLAWSVRDGPHYSPEYVNQGIPFITGGNVRPSGVDFANAKKISKELHQKFSERCKPEVGDILYTKGGTTGIARVNTYDREFSVWVHVAVLKLTGQIEPFYVQHALNSPFCYEQAQRFTHGVGNQDLGLTRMVRIILSLPPLAEQKEIISRIDYLQSIAEKTEDIVETSLKSADRLRQTILEHAFLGKLIPQDPTDEPAEELLKRIRGKKQDVKLNLKLERKIIRDRQD
jgi:type I restriction enzyme S subunit